MMKKKLSKEASVNSFVISSEMRIPDWQLLYVEQIPKIDGKLFYYRVREEYKSFSSSNEDGDFEDDVPQEKEEQKVSPLQK